MRSSLNSAAPTERPICLTPLHPQRQHRPLAQRWSRSQIAQKLQLQPYVPPPKPQAPQGQIEYKAFVKKMMMS